jgi:Zn finger protein HypA/HybF involved in hydrogenase expression
VSNNFFDQNANRSIPTLDSMEDTLSLDIPNVTRRFSQKKLSKSIETGRVEQGSVSDQKVVTVDKKFEYWSFHTIECKMLPVSQKINTVEDIQVKVYCTNCGAKLNKGHKFCGQCGTKA